jgi:hypothetical protein
MTTQTPAPPKDGINLKKLGMYLDGWGDLVEGMGTKATQVRYEVLEQLRSRNMPDVSLSRKTGYANVTSKDKRAYLISKTDPGVTTTIYVAEHGKDLYVSWRTYLDRVWNQVVLWVILGAALLFGAAQANDRYFGGFAIFMATFVGALIVEAGLVALAGFLFRRDPLAFFFVEVTVLDAEDISAMSLSVHKSILRALDQSGIEVSKLRFKEKFTGGRRGEDI